MDYKDLIIKNYINTKPVGSIGGIDILLVDIGIAGLLTGLPQHYRGLQSSGKTQMMRDFYSSFFASEKNALWEEGRADYRPKDLFQRLNISLAKGHFDSLPEIKATYSSESGIEYLIQSYVEDKSGELKLSWKKISKEEKEKVVADFSLTTTDLVELRRIGTKAFFIDEFNRCPEIVMNLFYGLMHGEVLHDGEIVSLGNGYYSGIAASNPEDFEGTFKMDKAMWSRFRVVLDFSAYETSDCDDKELIERQEKPGIVKSEERDLTKYLESTAEEIKNTNLGAKEKIILAYFKKGMNHCTSDKFGGISKSHIKWPLDCKDCERQTTLCGMLKGIDQRSVDAVKFLAKGIEKLALLKGAASMDPVESFVLAYKFVAPYKGILHPKFVKEKSGIEALVLEDYVGSIAEVLTKKFAAMDALIGKEHATYDGRKSLKSFKIEFENHGILEEYARLEKEINGKYEKEKLMSRQEFEKEFADEISAREKDAMQELIADIKDETIFGFLKKNAPEIYAEIDELRKASKITKKAYKKQAGFKSEMPYAEFISGMNKSLESSFKQVFDSLASEEAFCDYVFSTHTSIKKDVRKKIDGFINLRISESPMAYVPEEDKPKMGKELKSVLSSRLEEHFNNTLASERKALFAGEWSFLREYYDGYKEKQ